MRNGRQFTYRGFYNENHGWKTYTEQVRELLIEYTTVLRRDLTFQGIDDELTNLADKYSPPDGKLLVVSENGIVSGMVAYHRHSDERCEMKHLYVDPKYRGKRIGEILVEEIIKCARDDGYHEMILDTIQPLKSAIGFHRKFGFKECEPYYNNPMDDVIHIKETLW